MRYSAFISYNHRDRDWAIWLHRALERYSIPKRLRGRPAPWGEIEAKLPPVFRDRDELATSSDLAASVKEALAQSATLVVICSPNSAKSKWVDEEIRTFIASGREQFIRLIIVDGEPHSTDTQRECLPPSLVREGAPEPLAADVRNEADGKQGAKLKLLAGILGVSYDELRQREAARRQKRLAGSAAPMRVNSMRLENLSTGSAITRLQRLASGGHGSSRGMSRTSFAHAFLPVLANPCSVWTERAKPIEFCDRRCGSTWLAARKQETMSRATLKRLGSITSMLGISIAPSPYSNGPLVCGSASRGPTAPASVTT